MRGRVTGAATIAPPIDRRRRATRANVIRPTLLQLLARNRLALFATNPILPLLRRHHKVGYQTSIRCPFKIDNAAASHVAVEQGGTETRYGMEAEITELAAHLNAAECRWLLLVAEFDRREGWGTWECRSCAHWLNWKCSIALSAAHDRVRVAHCLGRLSLITAFAAGELSYSKVRALTRVATPNNEAALLDMARAGTAAHLERIVRAYRGALRNEEVDKANRIHDERFLHWHNDVDGSLVLRARLSPEQGALVVKALECAKEAVDESSAEDSSTGNDTRAQRLADALVVMAESFLATGPKAGTGRPPPGQRPRRSRLVGRGGVGSGGKDERCSSSGPAEPGGTRAGRSWPVTVCLPPVHRGTHGEEVHGSGPTQWPLAMLSRPSAGELMDKRPHRRHVDPGA